MSEGDAIEFEHETTEQEKARIRRELRRKKILENAKSRLEKLNGRSNDADNKVEDDSTRFSDPEVEPDIISTETTSFPSNFEDAFSFVTGVSSDNTKTSQNKFLKWKFHTVFAVVLGYICSILLNSEGAGYSIFIPAGVCILSETFFSRNRCNINPIAKGLTVLLGLDPKKANQLFTLYYITQNLIVDLCFVVFFSCIFGYLLHNTSDQLFYLVKFF